MKKSVYFEGSLKNYLKCLESEEFVFGLLLGQNFREHAYIVHMARTPLPKESSETESHAGVKSLHDVKQEWIMDHIHNITQMLPGGMTILGLFFVGTKDLYDKASITILRSLLASVNNFIKENEYYFSDNSSVSQIVLHYTPHQSIICKQHTTSTGSGFDTVECTPVTSNWHRIICYYDFQNLLPLYVQSITNVILHEKIMDILKHVSKSVKESKVLLNSEIRNSNELLKNIKDRINKTIVQNAGEPDKPNQIIADLYSPCEQRFSNKDINVFSYTAELKCFGTVCSDVYLHEDATVSDAIQAIKEDIIRSLYSRLTLHCNSLMEDLSTTSNDDSKIIHEPPRRVSIFLPYSKVRFTDYLFPGEDSLSTLPAKEQLDIRSNDHQQTIYEVLEAETDAAEFYEADNITNTVSPTVEMYKWRTRYLLTQGIIVSFVIVMIAVLFQLFIRPKLYSSSKSGSKF